MKVLDYTGLSRLTANIKAYITSKLEPLEDASPYILPGIVSAQGGMPYGSTGLTEDDTWLKDALTGGTALTLTSSTADTSAKKEILNRFTKGLPAILYVKVITGRSVKSPQAYIPLFPVGTASSSSDSAVYRTKDCWFDFSSGDSKKSHLQITITRSSTQVRISQDLYVAEPKYSEFEHLLPCEYGVASITASGTASASSTKLSSSSTGDALTLYNRLQNGMPPSIIVDMATSAGATRKVYCYLTQVTATGNTYMYESGTLANGTFTGKKARVNFAIGDMTNITTALMIISA